MKKRYIKINVNAELEEEGMLVNGDIEAINVSDEERIMLISNIINQMLSHSKLDKMSLISELFRYILLHDEITTDVD